MSEFAECVANKGCAESGTRVEWPGISKEEAAGWTPFCNANKKGRESHPMNCVSFDEAQRYCAWAGRRLPTEPEWELAARGTDGRPFPWGSESPSRTRVNACGPDCARKQNQDVIGQRINFDDGWEATSQVGAFVEGASPYGAFDMAGNVAEWTSSSFCPYSTPACGAVARAVRGGSWLSEGPQQVHATSRRKAPPTAHEADIGFRCVK